MTTEQPTILATSGGFRRPERGDLAFAGLVHHAVELSGATSRPKVCHLGTAGGDQRSFNAFMTEAGAAVGFDVTNLNLFPMPNVENIEGHLLGQDVVWVGGGSVANLLAVWQVHGLDEIFRRVWQAGVVLAGVSAGSVCWFRGGTTDSFGPELQPVTNGLGLLPYDNGVHYDNEVRRRPTVHALVSDGTLGETHCTDDGVGLVYRGTELVEAVTEEDDKAAYIVTKGADGRPVETRLEPRRLPR